MKRYLILFLFLFTSLFGAFFGATEVAPVRREIQANWKRHISFIEEYQTVGVDLDGKGLAFLRQSLDCLKEGVEKIDFLLKEYEKMSRASRKIPMYRAIKNSLKEEREVFIEEMAILEKVIQDIFVSIYIRKAQNFFDEALTIFQEAENRYKSLFPDLVFSEFTVLELKELALLYEKAEDLLQKAYNHVLVAKPDDENSLSAIKHFLDLSIERKTTTKKERDEWPKIAEKQKENLLSSLEIALNSIEDFTKKESYQEVYKTQKWALNILKTLIENTEGEEKESHETLFSSIQELVEEFEENNEINFSTDT